MRIIFLDTNLNVKITGYEHNVEFLFDFCDGWTEFDWYECHKLLHC